MSDDFLNDYANRMCADRPWREYPIGTKAHALMGGHLIKTERGWKWHCGNTLPSPGADAFYVTLPKAGAQ